GAGRHPRHRPTAPRTHPGEPGKHDPLAAIAESRAASVNRRRLLAFAALLVAAMTAAAAIPVETTLDSPQAAYAARRLREVTDGRAGHGQVELRLDAKLGAEAFSI